MKRWGLTHIKDQLADFAILVVPRLRSQASSRFLRPERGRRPVQVTFCSGAETRTTIMEEAIAAATAVINSGFICPDLVPECLSEMSKIAADRSNHG